MVGENLHHVFFQLMTYKKNKITAESGYKFVRIHDGFEMGLFHLFNLIIKL